MPQNKIALITGGSRGLGKNAATRIAEKGIDVILTYISKEAEANEVVNELKAIGVNAACLRLDVLVNNAGTGASIPFMNVTEENFDSLQNVHFKGVFFLTQKLAGLMND